MARGVNKVILIGNLGNPPEVAFTPGGVAIATFSIATSEQWKDKKTGEDMKKTQWHNIKVFNKPAETAGEYLKKGSKVYIEGSLDYEKWTDKETGQERNKTIIKCIHMQMLDKKGESNELNQEMPKYEQESQIQDDDIPF